VFWNLLKNAIKFTPHRGCVGIRCRLDGQRHVVADFTDSGIGIELEALPDGNGHDLMRQLRSLGHVFPGIALSGCGQEEDVRRSQEAGFAVHLTKPASHEALVEAIASATAGK
jgi:DNA-binding NarL/FixJ family response regulator